MWIMQSFTAGFSEVLQLIFGRNSLVVSFSYLTHSNDPFFFSKYVLTRAHCLQSIYYVYVFLYIYLETKNSKGIVFCWNYTGYQ